MTDPCAIEARHIVKTFGAQTRALEDVSIAIKPGEFFTLLGPSGCGKTTLLRLFAGFDRPTSGVILLDGADITALPPHKRPVNTVFQSYALFPHMNVQQNIAYGPRMRGKSAADAAAIAQRMLALVRMEAFAKRRIHELSGGQQQRVALARALASEPKVLLLDEPLSALDLKLRKEMQVELKRLQTETGITFVFVTHDQQEALTMSDRIGVMNAGKVLQIGTPREIYTRPANRFVAGFIGETNFLTGTLRGTLVAIEGAGAIRLSTDPGLPPGSTVTLTVRPEHVRIVPDNTAGALPATVKAQVYFGTDTHCHLALGGTEIVARLQSNPSGDPGLAAGTRVGLAFAPNAVQVLVD